MVSSPITAKRSANFSSQEESLLVSLTQKHKKVLECKLTDGSAHEEKRKTWGNIEIEFNLMSGQSYRAQDVLRRKYDNVKKRMKSKKSQEWKIMKSTDTQISTISSSVSQWAETKCQLQQSHSNFAEKENELKLKLMQEKHDKELALMQDKHDGEMCIMEKEAELKRKLMIEEGQARISKMKRLNNYLD